MGDPRRIRSGGRPGVHPEHGTRPADDAPHVGNDDEGEACVLAVAAGAVEHERFRLVERTMGDAPYRSDRTPKGS